MLKNSKEDRENPLTWDNCSERKKRQSRKLMKKLFTYVKTVEVNFRAVKTGKYMKDSV